jgi:SAM-dependent methyltransferase
MAYTEANDFAEKEKTTADFHWRLAHHDVPLRIDTALTLEIGGSGGVLGGILSDQVRRILVSDITDTSVQYDGQFGRLLKEKFARNGRELNLGKIEFHVADAMSLPYRDQLFDLVISQNAFEHIPNPLAALREVLRVTKQGGVIYLTFDPIWTADSGNHFSHFVPEPWSHLLLSDEEFCARMRAAGAGEFEVNDYLRGMNRKLLPTYVEQFHEILTMAGVSRFHYESWSGCVDPSYADHPNRRKAARALACSADDLLVRGLYYLIVK